MRAPIEYSFIFDIRPYLRERCVGIICPHVIKKLLGQDHRVTIPASCMSGSLLLLFADTLSRSMGNGSALPVGAITSLLGAPFFIAIIFSRKENRRC